MLYDTLIRPICIYADEVWGSFIKEKNQVFNINCNKYELFDKNNFEKLELKFGKTILGVHKKSSNAATRGELGRSNPHLYPEIGPEELVSNHIIQPEKMYTLRHLLVQLTTGDRQ